MIGLGTPLAAPDSLTDDEKAVWQEVVEGKPSDYFGSEQAELLVSYVQAVCRGRVIKGMVDDHLEVRDASEDWRKTFLKLNQAADRSSVLIHSLATSMRLTHQASYRADKVIKNPKKANELWQRKAA